MKRIFVAFFAFLLVFLFPHSIFAAQNFSVASHVSYKIEEDGATHVEFNITLKNKTSKYYASSYKINVGFDDIENVKIRDSKGSVKSVIHKSSGGNSIEAIFNDKVVGKDKEYSFVLSFETKDVVQNQGNAWELNIPGISNQEEFEDFTIQVNVPKSFGKPSYIKPSTTIREDSSNLLFTKEELQKSGISIAFGEKQLYEFTLLYHLKNSNFFPIMREIALPPSTSYQDVYYESLSPKPEQVVIDPDGNYLAQYNLSPQESKLVTAKGLVEISIIPKESELTREKKQEYLKPQKYWESDNQELKKIASSLKTPQHIYKFVVEHLTYDFSRVSDNQPRLGALQAFKNPTSAVCLEFTDLFIALSRAAGIPAREVNGFAYTQNSTQRPLSATMDILHAWPEYYDPDLKTWVMVDPTWSNTTGGVDYFHTLDFDHFSFIKKGISSEYPIPPGDYKLSFQKNSKDVQVTFTKKTAVPLYKSEVTTHFENSFMSGFPITGSMVVKNESNTMLPPQKLVLTVTKLLPKTQTLNTQFIPPYGHETLSFSYNTLSFLTKDNDTLTISVENKTSSYPFIIHPFVFTKSTIAWIGGIAGVIVITALFIFTIKTGRIRIPG